MGNINDSNHNTLLWISPYYIVYRQGSYDKTQDITPYFKRRAFNPLSNFTNCQSHVDTRHKDQNPFKSVLFNWVHWATHAFVAKSNDSFKENTVPNLAQKIIAETGMQSNSLIE